MKILSIDIGIKNLALCIINITNKDFFSIDLWKIIDLSEENKKTCNYNCKNKICNNKGKFFKNDDVYCKMHSSKSDYKILTPDLLHAKRLKINELIKLCKNYNIYKEDCNKEKLLEIVEKFINDNYLENITNLNANEFNLIDLGISIKKNLDKIDFNGVEKILIENQISPLASRMKSLQGMIAQYFILKNIENIQFISSLNKLKLFDLNKNTTYTERKKKGIIFTLDTLDKYNIDDNYVKYFNLNKKKDDLADCFLQVFWYIKTNKLIL